MKPNRFREVIAGGGIPIGHMVSEFATRGIAKIVESTGVDFVVVDMEHTSHSPERIGDLMAWFKATPIAPFVRVPQDLYHFIARTLDAGALGVMLPNVETPDAARAIVDAVKYAPLGKRGVGLGTAHTDYVVPDPIAYFKESNANTTVICQIESPTGVENAEAIAAIEGVDVLWVGHFDLSQGMEIPGEFQNPRFLDAVKKVADAARSHGKGAGVQPGKLAMAEQWMAMGYNVLSWSADMAVYRAALAREVTDLRALTAGSR